MLGPRRFPPARPPTILRAMTNPAPNPATNASPSLSHRVGRLKPSGTVAIANRAKQMKADGLDVLGFAAGEPDFDTPEIVCQAALDALNAGQTRYMPTLGDPATRQAIADTLYGALGVIAGSQGTMNNFVYGNATYQNYETICGGTGAGPGLDGGDAIQTHMTNTRITDPEVLENRYPALLC